MLKNPTRRRVAEGKTWTICVSRSRNAADQGLMANLPIFRVTESYSLRFGRNSDWLLFPLFSLTESTFIDIEDELTRD
jgi:hypothetical protein